MSSPDSSQAYDPLVVVTCRHCENTTSDQVRVSQVRDAADRLFGTLRVDLDDKELLLAELQKSVLDKSQDVLRKEEGLARTNEKVGVRVCHCQAQFSGMCKNPDFFPELQCGNQGRLIEVAVGLPLAQEDGGSTGAVTDAETQPAGNVWAGST